MSGYNLILLGGGVAGLLIEIGYAGLWSRVSRLLNEPTVYRPRWLLMSWWLAMIAIAAVRK